MREQFWILPSGDPDTSLRATVFRPADDVTGELAPEGRRPLAVINHGTSDETRLSVSMPVYYWLSRWFVERGYVVVIPQRRGHGATGGPLVEAVGTCADPDHFRSGQVAADDIAATVDFMTKQSFVETNHAIVVGLSTGGWASLALASRNLDSVRAIINFAGGRGGHARGQPNKVCGERRLVEAAGAFGRSARIPTLWLYSNNDSYFGPALASSMASAWKQAGGSVDLDILPPYGSDGHDIADDRAGWGIWGPAVDRFLIDLNSPAVATAPERQTASPASLTLETGSLPHH